MLIITRRILSGGFSFATTRTKLRKDRGTKNKEEENDQDAYEAYRSEVEKGSVLRQFRQDVFRRAELIEDWDGEMKPQKKQAEVEKMMNTNRE